jgi:hypothetical protein
MITLKQQAFAHSKHIAPRSPAFIPRFCKMSLSALTLPSRLSSAGSKPGRSPAYPLSLERALRQLYLPGDSGFSLNGSILRLSKIGEVKVVLHRPVEGRIKTCTITCSSTGKWHVMFPCEWIPL